jgi:hypothetical protein
MCERKFFQRILNSNIFKQNFQDKLSTEEHFLSSHHFEESVCLFFIIISNFLKNFNSVVFFQLWPEILIIEKILQPSKYSSCDPLNMKVHSKCCKCWLQERNISKMLKNLKTQFSFRSNLIFKTILFIL